MEEEWFLLELREELEEEGTVFLLHHQLCLEEEEEDVDEDVEKEDQREGHLGQAEQLDELVFSSSS